MQDFDSHLNRVSESVLSEYRNPPRWPRIKAADCCKEPQDFDDALVDVFQQMGALLIETKILTRFYRSIGARYSRSDDLNFAEEIRKARIEFERLTANVPCTHCGPGICDTKRIQESSRRY